MKAIRFHAYGPAENLVLDDVDIPATGPDAVLVRIQAAGVNPIDWKVRAGHMQAVRRLTLPMIPGWDMAGVVVQAGPLAMDRFPAGTAVYARTDGALDGTYAEFISVRADGLAVAPANLAPWQAAGVPLAALTAWMALFDKLMVTRGQRVLIHAAAGGVGGFAVQLARLAGAEVIGTCSAANRDYVLGLGANQVIDHTSEDFAAELSELDAVLDGVGGTVLARSYGVLRRGGALVSIAATPDEARAAEYGISVHRAGVLPNGARLAQITALIEAGHLHIAVSHRFPLAEAAAAHLLSETGRVRGKIVLDVAE